MKEKVTRAATYIKGFDNLVGGGLPAGNAILLSGSPGTGKSIMAIEFLLRGATKANEPGLFITFEETSENILKQASQVGLDVTDAIKKKKMFIRSLPEEEQLNETILLNMITTAVQDHGVKRIVIDSLDTYSNNILSYEDLENIPDFLYIKRTIFRLIKRLQKYEGVTKLLISETPEGSAELSKDGVSEFLCDGVIKIEYMSMGGDYSRQLKVRKMRSTKNNPDLFPMEITSKGVVVHSE